MLRLITAASGFGLMLGSVAYLDGLLSSRYGADAGDGAFFLALLIGGAATLMFAIKPTLTKSDALISTWMELKNAEMRARIDALKADSKPHQPEGATAEQESPVRKRRDW